MTAREILDSRGNPTVSAICELEDGVMAEASVPSGASTGANEAKEIRDGGKRYMGLGVLSAVENINTGIAPCILGKEFSNQEKLDNFLCNLDGTPDKSRYGANAILAVSMSFARAAAIFEGKELFEYLAENTTKYDLPTPMFNVLNGGKHAGNDVDIQESMVVPIGIKDFNEKLRAGSEIYHTLKNIIINRGLDAGLGDEGGFAPNLSGNEDVLKLLQEGIKIAGYSTNKVKISLDVAANSFFEPDHNIYFLLADEKHLESKDLISTLSRWVKKYDIYSIEDGLSEMDNNWPDLTQKISPAVSVGDDLFVTDPKRIEAGAKQKIANGVIIKLNQIGTVTEAMEAVKVAKKSKMKVIVSHRSGETEDSFIADFAVAVGADFIKSGAPARSERLAKYNRLSKIEEILKREI